MSILDLAQKSNPNSSVSDLSNNQSLAASLIALKAPTAEFRGGSGGGSDDAWNAYKKERGQDDV